MAITPFRLTSAVLVTFVSFCHLVAVDIAAGTIEKMRVCSNASTAGQLGFEVSDGSILRTTISHTNENYMKVGNAQLAVLIAAKIQGDSMNFDYTAESTTLCGMSVDGKIFLTDDWLEWP